MTAITTRLRAQYGLISASAFPPRATLAGSLPIPGGERALVAAVSTALAPLPAFPVQNGGARRLGEGVVLDLHRLDGRPNAALLDLALTIGTPCSRSWGSPSSRPPSFRPRIGGTGTSPSPRTT